jgi:PAS domain S-box-containing protein
MEGVIQEINKGALELFGYNKDELIGKKRVSIFSPGEIVIQNVLGWLEKANKEGKSLIKTNFIKKDGSQFNAEILITPNFANGKDQEQTGYCGITKEINEEVNIPINFLTKIFKGIAITRGGFTLGINITNGNYCNFIRPSQFIIYHKCCYFNNWYCMPSYFWKPL